MQTLLDEFKKRRKASPEGEEFLRRLEAECASDLWQSAGGLWSSESILKFRVTAIEKLAENLQGELTDDYHQAWVKVVRSFHENFWGEVRLLRKEKLVQSEEKKIFWELFSYIWILIQATLITKTAVFYFGIKSAQEDSSEGKVYVSLAILFSFFSLIWFAYRKSKKSKEGGPIKKDLL